MQTLTIKDLAATAELDRDAMASVRGGCAPKPAYSPTPVYCPPKPVCDPGYGVPGFDLSATSASFDASQMLAQSQNTTVNNGNNVAFSSGITANVAPSQNGSNNITLG